MPESRTQDVQIPTPRTKRETLGNMLMDLQVKPDARGVGFTGRAGPVEWRAQKTLGQPISAEVTVPVGQGNVRVGRGESGRFISLTQSLRWGK